MVKKIDNEYYLNGYNADLDGCHQLESEGFQMQEKSISPLGLPNENVVMVVYGKANDTRTVYVSDKDKSALYKKFGINLSH